jgi:hypothetical protein
LTQMTTLVPLKEVTAIMREIRQLLCRAGDTYLCGRTCLIMLGEGNDLLDILASKMKRKMLQKVWMHSRCFSHKNRNNHRQDEYLHRTKYKVQCKCVTIVIPDEGLETCHRRWDVHCSGTFQANRLVQKPTLRSYSSRNSVLATPVFGSVISMDWFKPICKFMHFNNNDNKNTYVGPPKLFKIYPAMSYLSRKFQTLCIPD